MQIRATDGLLNREAISFILNNYNQKNKQLLKKEIDLSIVFIKYKHERVYPLIENLEISSKENYQNYFPDKYLKPYTNNRFIELGINFDSKLQILALPVKEVYKRDGDYYAIFEDDFINLKSKNEDITVLWHIKEIKLPSLEMDIAFVDNFKNTLVQSSNFETAKKIKTLIQEEYDQDPFKYLLILGDFDIIPAVTSKDVSNIRDGGYTSLYNLNLKDKHLFSYVLDTLYYGNVDSNPDVDLSVGRLPFKEKEEYINYYHNLNTDIINISGFKHTTYPHLYNFNDLSYLIYPDKGYILAPERLIAKYNDIKVYLKLPFEQNYNADNIQTINSGKLKELLPQSYSAGWKNNLPLSLLISPSKENLINYFNNSYQVYFTTHGSLNSFTLTDNKGKLTDYFKVDNLPYFKNRPLIFAQSCSTARFMGKNFLNKGIKGYIGSYNPLFVNYDVFPLSSDSHKLSDLIKYHQNFYINSPDNKREGLESIIYLGDPTITYKPIPSLTNNNNLIFDVDLKDRIISFTEDFQDIFSFGFYNQFTGDDEGFYTFLSSQEQSNLINSKELKSRQDTFKYSIEVFPDYFISCRSELDYFYVPNNRGKTYFVNSTKKYSSSKDILDYFGSHFDKYIPIMKNKFGILDNISVFIKENNIYCGELALFDINVKPTVEVPIWKKYHFFFDDEKRIFYNVNDGPIQMYGKLREDISIPSKLKVKWYNSDVLIKEEIIDLYQYDKKRKSNNFFEIIFTYKDFYNFLVSHKAHLGTRLEITGVWDIIS